MKKTILIIGLIIATLAILLPFISRTPDGVQELTSDACVEQNQQASWNGIMSGYMVETVENPYFSTLIAGAFGTIIVLLATYVLGSTVAPKKRTKPSEKSNF